MPLFQADGKKGVAMVEGWRRLTVEEICEQVSVGIVIKPSQYYVDEERGIKAFRSANISENKIINRDWVYLSSKGHAANKKSALKAGDVLVVRSGVPGTACVVTPEYEGSNCIDVVFARPDRKYVLPEYLAAFTNSSVGKRHVMGNQGGLALKHFNVSAYKIMEVTLPPLPEQHKIADILRTWDEAIEKLEAETAFKEKAHVGYVKRLVNDPQCRRQRLRDHLQHVSNRNSEQKIERVLSVTNSAGFVLAEDQFAPSHCLR